MINLQQKRKKLKNRFILAILILTVFFITKSSGQVRFKVYGTWEITNMIFVAPPKKSELCDIWRVCQHKKIIIDTNIFVFKAPNCFLYRSISNFKITKQYVLSYENAISNDNYADKTIYYLFENKKKRTVEGLKTNYTFNSNEGDVPELEIFISDNNHLIINQGENIVFVKRVR